MYTKLKGLIAGSLIFALSAPAMAAENLQEMFSEGSVNANIKLLHFTRDFDGPTGIKRDFALGGTLYYKTDMFKGISFGTAFATTNALADNDDKGFYFGITAPVHEDVTRLQEYYVQGDYFNTTIKIGAHELNTPFLNKHPSRMINRSFRGLSINNKSIENLTLSGFYLQDNMGWVDDEFVSFTDDVYIAGATYQVPLEMMKTKIQAWYFTMPDSFFQTYFKVDFSKKINDFVLHGAPTVFTQKSQGDELDGELDTYQYGFNAGVGAFGFDLTGYYAKTGDDSIRDDWGYGKIILQQVSNSGNALAGDRSDEDAYAARLAYDFSTVGINGLKTNVMYGNYDAPAGVFEESSVDLRYDFSGKLKGLGVRFRFAYIDVENDEDVEDTRFYLTYRF